MLAATPITSLAIVIGKLLSALIYVLLLIAASIPLTAIVFVFGGVAPEDVLRGYLVLIVTALGLGAFGLFCSSLVKRTQAATAITIFGVLALTHRARSSSSSSGRRWRPPDERPRHRADQGLAARGARSASTRSSPRPTSLPRTPCADRRSAALLLPVPRDVPAQTRTASVFVNGGTRRRGRSGARSPPVDRSGRDGVDRSAGRAWPVARRRRSSPADVVAVRGRRATRSGRRASPPGSSLSIAFLLAAPSSSSRRPGAGACDAAAPPQRGRRLMPSPRLARVAGRGPPPRPATVVPPDPRARRSTARSIRRSSQLRGGPAAASPPAVAAPDRPAGVARACGRRRRRARPVDARPVRAARVARRSLAAAIPVARAARLADRRRPRPAVARRDGAGGRCRGAPRRPGLERAGAGRRVPGARPARPTDDGRRRPRRPARRGRRDRPVRPPPARRRRCARSGSHRPACSGRGCSRQPAAVALVAALLLVPLILLPNPQDAVDRPAAADPRGGRAAGGADRRVAEELESQGPGRRRSADAARPGAARPRAPAARAARRPRSSTSPASARSKTTSAPSSIRPTSSGPRRSPSLSRVAVARRDRQAGREPRRRSRGGRARTSRSSATSSTR